LCNPYRTVDVYYVDIPSGVCGDTLVDTVAQRQIRCGVSGDTLVDTVAQRQIR
jgi:hypothetical protein